MQLVQDGRQAAPQRQQLGAGAVEAHAHGALQRHAAAVAQQRAEREGDDRSGKGGMQQQSTKTTIPMIPTGDEFENRDFKGTD